MMVDNETLWDKVCYALREFIGGVGLRIFLWSISMTHEQYIEALCDYYESEE
jgi:hypothetical protein